MGYMKGLLTGVVGTLSLVIVVGGCYYLLAPSTPIPVSGKPPAPATVSQVLKEDQITTVSLTPEAETRLGIDVAPVEIRPSRRQRVYGGEVMVPLGRTIPVLAPLGGTLRAPEKGIPTPGTAVKKGDPILQLSPLLTPEARTSLATSRIEAEGQVETTRTHMETMRLALERARNLLVKGAGNRESLETAQSAFDIAAKSHDVARTRRDSILRITAEVERGTGIPIPLEAPTDGILRTVAVTPGQNVHAGGNLFEVIDLQTVWIRVPVYVGEWPELLTLEKVTVCELSARPGQICHEARPTVAPPSANALAATTDLFYEMGNPGLRFSPGQRVGVRIPLQGESESPTIPWSAIIHDIHGGAWVYEKTAPHTYTRRRVVVRYIAEDRAVLASGPPASTLVVTSGAAELFGTEVGFSK